MEAGAVSGRDGDAPPARGAGSRRLLPGRRTLRLRLTLWYVAVLAAIWFQFGSDLWA